MTRTTAQASTRRILYTAISNGHFATFHRPTFELLRSLGYEIHIAANQSSGFEPIECDRWFQTFFDRSPFSRVNLKALLQLIKILRSNHYEVVHCHTPVAAALTRLAALFLFKSKPIVIYTAHGFHFYPGAPITAWILWKSLERLLALRTDIAVAINAWDRSIFLKWLGINNVFQIPGMGIDLTRFQPPTGAEKAAARVALDIPPNAVLLIYVAEFIPRKNHRFAIEGFAQVVRDHPTAKLIFVGKGPLQQELLGCASGLGIADSVMFAGFRLDVEKLYAAADVAISTSLHEGLGIALVEALASGIPVVASRGRGHDEFVRHGHNGFMYEPGNLSEFSSYLSTLITNAEQRRLMGTRGRDSVQPFSVENSVAALRKVYARAAELAAERGV